MKNIMSNVLAVRTTVFENTYGKDWPCKTHNASLIGAPMRYVRTKARITWSLILNCVPALRARTSRKRPTIRMAMTTIMRPLMSPETTDCQGHAMATPKVNNIDVMNETTSSLALRAGDLASAPVRASIVNTMVNGRAHMTKA